ncbi:MAG: nucleotidyltransferase domain-containing protein [Spirochaetia bacterium]
MSESTAWKDDFRVRFTLPESIILFGSRATGTAQEASDFDLLIVTSAGGRPVERRATAERALSDRAAPLDILVYSPQE